MEKLSSTQEQQFGVGGAWTGSGMTAEKTLSGGRKIDPECIAALPQDAMWTLLTATHVDS